MVRPWEVCSFANFEDSGSFLNLTPESPEFVTAFLLKIKQRIVKMARDQDEAKGEKPDPERDYNEGMAKKLKRLENTIADFVELQQMDIPKKDLVGAAKEVVECRDATKEAYNRIEATNEVLVKGSHQKRNVPNCEKSP